MVMQSFFRGLGEFRIAMIVSLLQTVLRVILSFWLVPSLDIPAIAHAAAAGCRFSSCSAFFRTAGCGRSTCGSSVP
ncbi:MAG: hypothetical protein MR616_02185 [Pyramidobacter sp.]|nr:hypothetical protein [Pyramidobacter sp.]